MLIFWREMAGVISFRMASSREWIAEDVGDEPKTDFMRIRSSSGTKINEYIIVPYTIHITYAQKKP